MSFLQFFVWGAWLITIGIYCSATLDWSFSEFGAIFSTMGLSALFMPTLIGFVADKWINAERLYSVLHLGNAVAMLILPTISDPSTFFWVVLFAMICYMPTLALSNSIAYQILKSQNNDVIKIFPTIRVWGTVGFIAAMWITNLSGNKATEGQFYISAIAGVILAVYALTLPKCPPQHKTDHAGAKTNIIKDALKLMANYKMALFFVFSMLLGAALQLTNMYGDSFLSSFESIPKYADLLVVRYSTIIMSISQISETLFILAIPFFLKRYGIKKVMLMSMFAWVLRFGLLAYANPADGLWMIIMSCIVYGMAFDFFNVSGSLFVETTASPKIRASAQGLFMMMTNGVGAILGSFLSGVIIDKYFVTDGILNWTGIWLTFSAYAFIVMVLFAVLFKHKHDPNQLRNISH
jgi:NHS family xanthosine MFS transporter